MPGYDRVTGEDRRPGLGCALILLTWIVICLSCYGLVWVTKALFNA